MNTKELKNSPITKELENWRKKLKDKADRIRKERAKQSEKIPA